jgi:excisionase family DNA binding protein
MSNRQKKEGQLFYSVTEAAEIFGKSTDTIRRWIRDGTLKATKQGKGQQAQHLISRKEIERLGGF